MRNNRIFTFFSFVCLFISLIFVSAKCQSEKNSDSTEINTTEEESIPEIKSNPTSGESPLLIIGEGGGVTGAYTQYRILENGNIQQYDFDTKKYTQVGEVDASQVDELRNTISEMDLGGMNLNKPGNYNYYIEILKDGKPHRIQWNQAAFFPGGLKTIYSQAQSLVQKANKPTK